MALGPVADIWRLSGAPEVKSLRVCVLIRGDLVNIR